MGALVLARLAGQSIIVDDGQDKLTITVVRLSHNTVRLAFEGTKRFNIVRAEVLTEGEASGQQEPDNRD